MVTDGMDALERQDADLYQMVRAKDDRLDAYDVDIEHAAVRLLITRQPAARDARVLGASLR